MKGKMHSATESAHQKRRPIRTSLLEVLKEITALTQDDALVLAVFKRIFNSHRVRLTRTLAPVKLVASKGATSVLRPFRRKQSMAVRLRKSFASNRQAESATRCYQTTSRSKPARNTIFAAALNHRSRVSAPLR